MQSYQIMVLSGSLNNQLKWTDAFGLLEKKEAQIFISATTFKLNICNSKTKNKALLHLWVLFTYTKL